MQRAKTLLRPLMWLALLASTPLLAGFMCFPFVAPPPSGVVTPTPAALFAPTVSASVSDNATSATANIVVQLAVPDGSTLPIGALFDIPAGWTVASDVGVTDGSLVGSIMGSMTVADPLFYDCNTPVTFDPNELPTPTDIKLYDATTSTASTVPGADTDNNGKPDVIEDVNPANGLPDGIDRYPDFLTTILPGTHKARYFGATEAAGLSDFYVNVIVVELASGGPHRVLTIVNDPLSPPESATVQFCSPQSFTLTLYGVSGAQTILQNPSVAGTYIFTGVLVSEFDLDNDGVANGLDNCPATANASQADADLDYVGDACETNGVANFDVDNDGTENGYDNCIFVANAGQEDGDFDDIGDACDLSPAVPSGPNYFLSCSDPVGIGQSDPGGASCVQGTPTPMFTPTATPTPKDPDGDTDGDTVVNSVDLDDDGDGCPDANETQTALGSQTSGGLRDPHNPWDYFNPTGDGVNRVDDVLTVVGKYFVDAYLDSPDNTIPNPAYTPGTDRTGLGPDNWNLGPPDGLQRVDDILAAVYQYFHDCP